MTQQTATILVQFSPNTKLDEKFFKHNQDYQVFGIDIYDTDKGEKVTEFLIANNTGQFKWININYLIEKVKQPHCIAPQYPPSIRGGIEGSLVRRDVSKSAR